MDLLDELDRGRRPNGFHADRYRELAVFPEDAEIPLATIARLWRRHFVDSVETEELVEHLHSLGLLQTLDLERHIVSLHDAMRQYLASRVPPSDMRALHSAVISSHGAVETPEFQDTVTAKPYYYRHILYHLRLAGEWDQIVKCLTHQATFDLIPPDTYGMEVSLGTWHGASANALQPAHLLNIAVSDRINMGGAIADLFASKARDCIRATGTFPCPGPRRRSCFVKATPKGSPDILATRSITLRLLPGSLRSGLKRAL